MDLTVGYQVPSGATLCRVSRAPSMASVRTFVVEKLARFDLVIDE
jgi:hypothetical protein